MNKVSQGVEDKFFVSQTECREGQGVWKGTMEELDHKGDAEKAGEHRAFMMNHEKGVCRGESLGALPAEVHKRGNEPHHLYTGFLNSHEKPKRNVVCAEPSLSFHLLSTVIDESHLQNS